uniref:Uncharacterized protein n=1 Tax=Hyaloperonospora arabidopsidis (strain Emoy2) TaxID=559515 RepID=M4C335_HYAAE
MEHLLMFGLEITKTGADSRVHGHKPSVVRAVLCLFCMHLGRDAVELDDGSKRQRTQNTNYFTAAFRKENFTLLVKLQHPADFEMYSSLGSEEKKSFFNVKNHTQDSIHRYVQAAQTVLNIPVFKAIVKIIIGEIFLRLKLDEDGEEMEPITKTNAFKLFK